jgi:hypothetical protein
MFMNLSLLIKYAPAPERLRDWLGRAFALARGASSSVLLALALCVLPFAVPPLLVFFWPGELPKLLSQADLLGGVRTAARVLSALYCAGVAIAAVRQRFWESCAYVAAIFLLSVGV